MDIGIVSMRYAKALIDYAYNSGKEDIMYREFSTLAHSLETYPELREALLNPILSTEDSSCLSVQQPVVNNRQAKSSNAL